MEPGSRIIEDACLFPGLSKLLLDHSSQVSCGLSLANINYQHEYHQTQAYSGKRLLADYDYMEQRVFSGYFCSQSGFCPQMGLNEMG